MSFPPPLIDNYKVTGRTTEKIYQQILTFWSKHGFEDLSDLTGLQLDDFGKIICKLGANDAYILSLIKYLESESDHNSQSLLNVLNDHVDAMTYRTNCSKVNSILADQMSRENTVKFINMLSAGAISAIATNESFQPSEKLKIFALEVDVDTRWFFDLCHGNSNVSENLKSLANCFLCKEKVSVCAIEPIVGHIDIKHVYLRACYKSLFDIIEKNGPQCNVCIGGNPGCGKTVFAYFVFAQLQDRISGTSASILLVKESTEWVFFDGLNKKGSQGIGYDSLPMDWRQNEKSWLLLDGSAPSFFLAKRKQVVIFASPDKRNYEKFINQTQGIVYYMPTWSLEEIKELISELYTLNDPLIDSICSTNQIKKTLVNVQKAVKKRYHIVGGKLRLLINRQTLDELKRMLEIAISSISSEFLNSIDDVLANGNTRSIVYSIKPDPEDYRKFTVSFCSDIACKKALNTIIFRQMDLANEFYTLLDSNTAAASLKGMMFKQHAHRLISAGCTLPIRKLKFKEEDILQTKITAEGALNTIDDFIEQLNSTKDIFYRVTSSNDQLNIFTRHIPRLKYEILKFRQKLDSFKTQEQDDSEVQFIEFQPSVVTKFNQGTHEALLKKTETTGYLAASSRNFPTVDAFAIDNFSLLNGAGVKVGKPKFLGLQMTVARKHGYNENDIAKYHGYLKERKDNPDTSQQFKLAFVVPMESFASYTYQGSSAQNFEQYVIGLDTTFKLPLDGDEGEEDENNETTDDAEEKPNEVTDMEHVSTTDNEASLQHGVDNLSLKP